jgi:hypothetical protein
VVSGAMRSHNHQARISWQGPDVRLGPRAALALSLALHELGTNATKYGALSVPDGRVVIVWTIAENADDRQFRFEWKEAGGPAVTPPTRKGFGSRLIERELATSLGGDVRISYEATGLILSLATPFSALQDKSRVSGGIPTLREWRYGSNGRSRPFRSGSCYRGIGSPYLRSQRAIFGPLSVAPDRVPSPLSAIM